MDLKMRITSYLTNLTLFKITLTTTMQRPHQGRYAMSSFELYLYKVQLWINFLPPICDQTSKDWTKTIQNEWKLLQRDLPGRYIYFFMMKSIIYFLSSNYHDIDGEYRKHPKVLYYCHQTVVCADYILLILPAKYSMLNICWLQRSIIFTTPYLNFIRICSLILLTWLYGWEF